MAIKRAIKSAIKRGFKRELKRELKKELKQELKQKLKQDLKQDLKQELKRELKRQLMRKLKRYNTNKIILVLQILTGGDLFVTRYTFVTLLIILNVKIQRKFNQSYKINNLLFFVTFLILLFKDFFGSNRSPRCVDLESLSVCVSVCPLYAFKLS